ncbi:hypothetical protein SAMN04488516_101454 [Desulfonauticus submarinus]|uniref:YlxR domain-containing protein n=2 Tax=Desulfonauticus submarinus TaxID=206665 RepID=A0A1H0AKR0_9BACT|nr:hypothetical protein SAMN04488516_101454 [Desulfonauticus submarinus]
MKKRHVPIRMCIICRKKAPKKELIRFVCIIENNKKKLIEDIKQTKPGRGFYVCSPKCKEKLNTFKGWLKKCKGVKN